MPVHEGSTAAGGGVGSCQQIEIGKLGRTKVTAALVDGVGQLEGPSDNDLCRCLRLENDILGKAR